MGSATSCSGLVLFVFQLALFVRYYQNCYESLRSGWESAFIVKKCFAQAERAHSSSKIASHRLRERIYRQKCFAQAERAHSSSKIASHRLREHVYRKKMSLSGWGSTFIVKDAAISSCMDMFVVEKVCREMRCASLCYKKMLRKAGFRDFFRVNISP